MAEAYGLVVLAGREERDLSTNSPGCVADRDSSLEASS